MVCRTCGRALDEDARFCPDCGSGTGGRCQSCGLSLDADARFCKQCGTPVDGGHSERDARERKVATLLFADLVDFTAMGEAHDPEMVSTLVGQTFERLAAEVRRYEGTIEKFAGDAMLAVFGVPATHEDDPERAVRAALEMQAAMVGRGSSGVGMPALALRIGIESGEVLVDRSRASSERDLFVTGDAVNTAARLEAAAEPAAVVVGPIAHEATRHVVDYAALDPLELKGKAIPVEAWRAVAVRTGRGGRRAPSGLQAPLVGRGPELARLKAVVAETVETGRPHLITIIGSAGVGKSRHAWELEKYVDGLPDPYHWLKGRCLAYAGPSFGPIADVVKSDAHVADDDPPERARELLATRLEQLPLDDDQASGVRDALEAILGIGPARERSRGEMFQAWRRYLEAIARLHPLVLVIEDIHWADEATLSFLDLIARWGDGAIALVCLARHELFEVRPGWGSGLPNATTVTLEPLDEAAGAQLVAGLTGTAEPPTWQVRVASLAEGNPLFAEELVRMLIERGALRSVDGAWQPAGVIDEIEIPSTIHAVIAARLDALSPAEKRTAQHAAVVGRIFWDRLVAHLVGSSLDDVDERLSALRMKDLVIAREPSALAGAAEYGFRHVLVRDVAYESIPKRERSGLHRDVAAWAEESLADRIDEFTELIASHLLAAIELEREFEPDGSVDVLALRRLAYPAVLRASRRAASLGQVARACQWMRATVDLAKELSEDSRSVARLVDEDVRTHGSLIEVVGHDAMLTLATGGLSASLPLDADDTRLLARLRCALAQTQFAERDVEGARATLRHGLDDLDEGTASAGRARLLWNLGHTFWRSGPSEEAPPLLERAVAEARADGDEEVLRWAMHELGIVYSFQVRMDKSVQLVEESYRLAVAANDRALIERCGNNLPRIRYDRGDALAPLAAMTEEALRGQRRSGASVAYTASNLANYMMEMGRLDEALAFADEAAASAESHGGWGEGSMQIALIRHLREEGNGAERTAALRQAAEAQTEPQAVTDTLLAGAWAMWLSDREGALVGLGTVLDAHYRWYGVIWLDLVHEAARMALRLDDRTQLTEAVALHQQSRWPGGPAMNARSRWVDGLLADDGGAAVEQAAEGLSRVDYVLKAMDAWTDAALMATRAGRSSDAGERARSIMEATGMHPFLGPPEPDVPDESSQEPRSRITR